MTSAVLYRVKIIVASVVIGGLFTAYAINNHKRVIKYEKSGVVRELGDFGHFYYAAVAMSKGQDIYTSWKSGYIYPPLIAFLYLPLAGMTESQAAYVLMVVNSALVLAALWVCSREFLRRMRIPPDLSAAAVVALLGMLVVVDKIKGELQMWQTNAIIVLMFALSLRWLDRWPVLAGAALGVILNIKYLSIGMLPYLILRRRWTAAASFVAFSVIFALLPATVSGWRENNRDLRTAIGGLFHMTGSRDDGVTGKSMANVEDLKNNLSCSVTSAIARVTAGSPMASFALSGLVAAAVVGGAMLMYRSAGVPVLLWPAARGQQEQPFQTMVGVEWAALIAAALAFSPQTNTRHLIDAIVTSVCIASLCVLVRRGVPRWPAIAAAVLLFCGLHLPPGNRDVPWMHQATLWWTGVGGPSWCLLLAAMLMMWTGLKQAIATQNNEPINLSPILQPISPSDAREAVPTTAAPMRS